jgi:prevent-host-death family protein
MALEFSCHGHNIMVMHLLNMEVRMQIAAGVFKAKCLSLMDDVSKFHHEITITKHGRPVAKIVPCGQKKSNKKGDFFGMLSGSVAIKGDIVKSTDASWEADEN